MIAWRTEGVPVTTLPRRNRLILRLDMPDPARALATVRALREAVRSLRRTKPPPFAGSAVRSLSS